MILWTQQLASENTPAVLTDEQRRRVADALESAQSENTRRNYARQFGKFRTWCELEDYSPLPTQAEVLAAYAAELADDGKSMSTLRLAVAAMSMHTGARVWSLHRRPALRKRFGACRGSWVSA